MRFEPGVPFPGVDPYGRGRAVDDAGEPSELARRLLSGQSDRWDHTREVAARAQAVALAVPDHERQLLVDAAWLHDIGYSPEVSRTGFHPLDGAWYLMSMGASGTWSEPWRTIPAHDLRPRSAGSRVSLRPSRRRRRR